MPSRFCRVCAAEGIKLTNMGRGGNSCGKKLATCVPEIDLYLVEDPLICKTCSQMVDVAYTLREVCLRNEKHLTVKSLQNVLRVIKRPTKKGIAVYTDDDAVVYISDDEYNNVTGNKPELTVVKHHNVHVETANINCCSSSFYCSICDKSFLGEDSLDLHHKEFHVAAKNSNIETEVVTTNEIIAKKVDDPNRVPLYEIKPKRKSTLDDVSVKKTIIECKDYEVVDGAEVFDKYVEMRNYPSKETRINELSKNKVSSTDKELDVEVNSICDVCGESFAPCDLESHSLTHLKNVCQLCDKTFASNIELEKHAELHFTKCCGTKFQTGCAMQLHTYHKHGKSCGICKECFDTFKALFQHLLVHADEKLDLRCIDCNATFKDEKQHKAHLCGNFVCEQCGASWQTELELENHRKEHVADSIPNQGRKSDITESATPLQLNESKDDEDQPQLQTWTCDDCKKVFNTLMQLTEHDCLNYNCQYCGFLCRSKYIYNTHLLMHNNDKDFPCDLCSNKFISKHALISHVKTHYSELCQLCNQGFKSAKLLTRHYTSVHCKMLNVALVDYKKHGLLQVRKPSEKYMCGACKSEYSTLSNFHAHVRHSHEYCEVCKRTISRIDYMVQHIKWHYGRAMPKEPLSCPTPTTSNQPMPELRLQITNTAYFCEICQIEFQDQMKYVHHVQDMHTQRDTYTSFCQICQLHFEVENKYFDHMKIVHRQCHICQKSFNNNLLLLSHIKTHDISPNKTCPVCGKKFLNETRLHKHLNCHNKKTGFVVCFVCKKRCKNMHRLMCHFRTHLDNNVKCSFCDKHFKTTSNCNLHIRLVHGRCTIEGGSVNDDDDESVPVEELANETVASCVICKDKFENMDVLMKHIGSHI